MLRMLGAAQKREVKATQNLAIIVLFFMICWIPLYTINCVLAFCHDCKVDSSFMFSCIILSHLNSAGNPLLYAYHLRDFRSALKNFFCNLFGYKEAQTPNARPSCNYNDRLSRNNTEKARSNSQIYYQKKSEVRMTTTAATIAVASAETNRHIWTLPEGSSDSSDSLKHNEKVSIVRPATPYRPHQTNDVSQINPSYVESSSVDEESDDVFIDDSLPFTEFKHDLETNLTDKIKNELKIVSETKPLSNSSPQLSRGLFFVESDVRKPFARSYSSMDGGELKKIQKSPFRARIFKNRPKLGRSLSDEGTTSNESMARKSNVTVPRSSCGS